MKYKITERQIEAQVSKLTNAQALIQESVNGLYINLGDENLDLDLATHNIDTAIETFQQVSDFLKTRKS